MLATLLVLLAGPGTGGARAEDGVIPAAGGVSFTFDYREGAELWSPQARGAMEWAAGALASYFIVDQPITVNLAVVGINAPGAPNIASSFVEFTGAGQVGFFPTAVQEKILTGFDPNGPAPDAEITWNFAESWSFGDEVPNNAYDAKTVIMHELMHTFGFLSGAREPLGEQRHWNTYDGFLRTADGAAAIDEAFVFKPGDVVNLTGGDGGLYFGGPNAAAAYGGPVPLFTPDPWASASRSVSHVNALSGYLMDPFNSYGPGPRALSPVEIAMMRDLGYALW